MKVTKVITKERVLKLVKMDLREVGWGGEGHGMDQSGSG
jgi:hypothetical protein